MSDPKTVLSDPNFWAIKDENERIKVMDAIDPGFAKLDPQAKRQIVSQPPAGGLSLGKGETIGPEPTLGERLLSDIGKIGRGTIQNLPETGGMVTGAFTGGRLGTQLGGPIGGVLGAVGGGALGAGGGKAIEQALARVFPSIFGEPPKSTGEALGKQFESAKFGLLSEAGGQVTPKLLKPILQRTLSPAKQEILDLLRKEKVPVRAGDIRRGGPVHLTENLMRGTLLGGRIMNESDIEQAKALDVWKTRFLRSFGENYDKTHLGQLIKNSVETRSDQLDDMFQLLYSEQADLFKANVDTRYIRAEGQKLLKEVQEQIKEGRFPSAHSPESPSRFVKLLQDMSNYGTTQAPPLPSSPVLDQFGRPAGALQEPTLMDLSTNYGDVWKGKQMVDQLIRAEGPDVMRTTGKSMLKRIHNVLDTAMERAAPTPEALARIRKVNAAYGQAKELMETKSAVAAMRKGDYDPEKVVDVFFRPQAITPAKELRRAIPLKDREKLRPVIQRRILENLFEPATRELEEGIEIMSGSKVQPRFKKAYESMELWFSKEELNRIEKFIEASKTAQNASRLTNPMSGRLPLLWDQWKNLLIVPRVLLEGAAGYAVGGGLGAPAAVFGPHFVAKFLASKKGADLLIEGFKMTPIRAVKSGYGARLAAFLSLNGWNGKFNEQPQTEPPK